MRNCESFVARKAAAKEKGMLYPLNGKANICMQICIPLRLKVMIRRAYS